MYYEIHGQSDAPAVVLSSGLGGSAHYWAPQLPALAQHFRVIAYDQHGTGRSGGTVPEGYSIGDMAAEVVSMLDSIGVERCHFVGHALGGFFDHTRSEAAPSRMRCAHGAAFGVA